jgi:transcriptional regulator with XRE-family HTH domain
MTIERSPSLRLRRLAAELRRARERQNLTGSQAAKALQWSAGKLSKIEKTETKRISSGDLDKMMDLYKIEDPAMREAMHALAKDAKVRGWWSKYKDVFGPQSLPDFEAEASMIRTYQCQVVPGLLQTPAYAEAIFRGGGINSDEEVTRKVDARMRRQHALTRHQPLHLWAVIDEAALRRVPGTVEVMQEQLQHLLNMAMHHNVDIQVLPFDAGMHAALSGSFVLLDFPNELDPSIAYTETSTDSLFVQESTSMRRYVTIFAHLNSAALRPSESVRFLRQILESSEQHVHD